MLSFLNWFSSYQGRRRMESSSSGWSVRMRPVSTKMSRWNCWPFPVSFGVKFLPPVPYRAVAEVHLVSSLLYLRGPLVAHLEKYWSWSLSHWRATWRPQRHKRRIPNHGAMGMEVPGCLMKLWRLWTYHGIWDWKYSFISQKVDKTSASRYHMSTALVCPYKWWTTLTSPFPETITGQRNSKINTTANLLSPTKEMTNGELDC